MAPFGDWVVHFHVPEGSAASATAAVPSAKNKQIMRRAFMVGFILYSAALRAALVGCDFRGMVRVCEN
jgi:hypothetical protein